MLNPIEEKKFEDLKALFRELKVPAPPEIMIGLKVHDRNSVLIFDDVQRGHSWTRNFWNFMFSATIDAPGDSSGLFGAGYMSGKTTGGTIRSSGVVAQRAGNAAVGYGITDNTTAFGIMVGTGDTAFSIDNFVLVTPIASGNSGSKLYYQAQVAPVVAYTAGTKTWKTTHHRIFNNNSGGSITVKEVGLYWSGNLFWSAVVNLFERSVLSPTVAVPNGAQLTVTYQISMDFSAID
jgi:hypothetical protein